jgi:hypothetical protein
MTREEVDKYEQELHDIITRLRRSPRADADMNEAKKHLRELGANVGASEYAPGGESDASISQFVHSIHQALQTASMIDACRAAAESAELTAESLQLTEQARTETRKAQRWVVVTGWATIVMAVGTIGTAIAAWCALWLRP